MQNKAARVACQAHNLDVIGSNPIFAMFWGTDSLMVERWFPKP